MIGFNSALNYKIDRHHQDDDADLDALITDLGNANGQIRQNARISLVRIGEPAVEALIETLNNRDGITRWEAAKALSQVSSPKAAQTLVKALEDDEFSIRWLAAVGLSALGRDGLKPLLEALWQTPASSRLREGARHVLHGLISQAALDRQLLAQSNAILAVLNYLNPAVALLAVVMPALKMLEQPEN